MRKSIIEITRDIRPSMALELEPQPAQRRQSPCTPDNLFRLIQSGPVWGVRMNGKLVALGDLKFYRLSLSASKRMLTGTTPKGTAGCARSGFTRRALCANSRTELTM